MNRVNIYRIVNVKLTDASLHIFDSPRSIHFPHHNPENTSAELPEALETEPLNLQDHNILKLDTYIHRRRIPIFNMTQSMQKLSLREMIKSLFVGVVALILFFLATQSFAQSMSKQFVDLLDIYIEKEISVNNLDPGEVVIETYFDRTELGYSINLMLSQTPVLTDEYEVYRFKGLLIILRYPPEFESSLSHFFEKATVNVKQPRLNDINTMYDPLHQYLFQFDWTGRLNVMSTSDDKLYLQLLRNHNFLISNDLKLTKDLIGH